jgi:hypothetical protein
MATKIEVVGHQGTDVLINKVGITDAQALDAFEADATAIRMFELFQDPMPGSSSTTEIICPGYLICVGVMCLPRLAPRSL